MIGAVVVRDDPGVPVRGCVPVAAAFDPVGLDGCRKRSCGGIEPEDKGGYGDARDVAAAQ